VPGDSFSSLRREKGNKETSYRLRREQRRVAVPIKRQERDLFEVAHLLLLPRKKKKERHMPAFSSARVHEEKERERVRVSNSRGGEKLSTRLPW